MRRRLLLVLVACSHAGTEELRAEWDAFVDAHRACEVDTDCAIVFAGCPLDCGSVVSADAVDAAEAEAVRLIAEYTRDHPACTYHCTPPRAPVCGADGACVATDRSRAVGGG